ncbi:uncharacterized protein CBL_05570 [Carabus blaptoides fortunei]
MDHSVLLAVLCTAIVLHVPTCGGTCPPGSVVERGVYPHVKQQIVNIHNEYRRQNAMGRLWGQPKAANMLRMSWDESIAQQAQALANTCEFRHVTVKDPRFAVGQNLYTSYNSEDKPGANWTRAVQSWYDENKSYRFGNRVYNHYTQVIWATSYKVGCGYVKYRTHNGVKRLYVCHYGPGGNIVGRAPYQIGNGCENLCLSTDSKIYKLRPRPLTHWSNILPFTPKPKPYSFYSKPRPPYRPKSGSGFPKYRPPLQQNPKVQPGYKATREDAVLAMLLYFLIQHQAELEAKKARAKQQESEYYDGQNDPLSYRKYRRLAYRIGTDNTNNPRHLKSQPFKKHDDNEQPSKRSGVFHLNGARNAVQRVHRRWRPRRDGKLSLRQYISGRTEAVQKEEANSRLGLTFVIVQSSALKHTGFSSNKRTSQGTGGIGSPTFATEHGLTNAANRRSTCTCTLFACHSSERDVSSYIYQQFPGESRVRLKIFPIAFYDQHGMIYIKSFYRFHGITRNGFHSDEMTRRTLDASCELVY